MQGLRITVALAILAMVPTGAAAAVAPKDKCEATKLTATGTYALCRLKAEAKAARKGTALSGGAVATVTEQAVFRDTARVLFTLDVGWFVIEDGVDTYVVRNGRIQRQTSHWLITFNGPPPF